MSLSTDARRLLGHWVSDLDDHMTGEKVGRVTMEFRPDGTLIYTIHGAGKESIIVLQWVASSGEIVTTQPSAPREERTRYRVEEDKLELTLGSVTTRFRREVGP